MSSYDLYRSGALQLGLGAPVITVDDASERLRDAIDIRVDLHRQRCIHGAISVDQYLTGLRWVRALEDELEPIRAAAGYTWSRAFELCTAHTADFYKSPDGPRYPGPAIS